jgi:hypothetical protein
MVRKRCPWQSPKAKPRKGGNPAGFRVHHFAVTLVTKMHVEEEHAKCRTQDSTG